MGDPKDEESLEDTSSTSRMTTEVHPIQAAVPSWAYTTFSSSYEAERYCGIKTCFFSILSPGVGLCCVLAPCIKCCPLDERMVYDFDESSRPPELLEAVKKLRNLGIVPTVIFPGGSIAAKGEMKMTKSIKSKGAQNRIMEEMLDEEELQRFHHVMFDSVPDFKPDASMTFLHYYYNIPRTLVGYTICLPLTIAEKTKSCGCSDEFNNDQIKDFILEFIETTIVSSTKPNAPARQFAGKLFAAGCWDGPMLIHHLAPLVNDHVNRAWNNIEVTAYVGKGVNSVLCNMLIKSSGWNEELKMKMLMLTKCLIVRTCLENCNEFSEAWDSSNAKSTASAIGTWFYEKLDIT